MNRGGGKEREGRGEERQRAKGDGSEGVLFNDDKITERQEQDKNIHTPTQAPA
jgi:hypothetical protein